MNRIIESTERRRFTRRDPASPFDVELASGSLAIVPGAVDNISRGGVLVRVWALPSNAGELRPCVLRFRGAAPGVRPLVSRGTIIRSDVTAAGAIHLAIEFSEPLISLGPDAPTRHVFAQPPA